MRKPSRLDYAYAVGRVRVLETNLIPRAVFWEVAAEENFSGAMKAIFDAGTFLEEKLDIQSSEELDGFISNEETDLVQLISGLLLDKDVFLMAIKEDDVKGVLSYVQSTRYSFMKEYFSHKFDLSNLKILCRVKYSNMSKEKFEKLIVKGGLLDEKFLIQSFELSNTEIGSRLQASSYQSIWNKGVDALENRETFIELERAIEDFLMDYLREAKHIVFGPEPVFAYALARKKELKLVRLLGVGKLNRIPSDILKERISETYV